MPENKITCPSCSARLKLSKPAAPGKAIKCPKCGKAFSVSSGAPAGAGQRQTDHTGSPSAPRRNSGKKRLLLAVLALLLLLGIAGAYYVWENHLKKPPAVAQNPAGQKNQPAPDGAPPKSPDDNPLSKPASPSSPIALENYLSPDFNGVAVLHPSRAAQSPILAKLPLDDLLEEFIDELHIDPRQVEELVLLFEPYPAGRPQPGSPKTDPATGYEFTSPVGGFSVTFPGKPERSSEKHSIGFEWVKGRKVGVERGTKFITAGTGSYRVFYRDLDRANLEQSFKKALEREETNAGKVNIKSKKEIKLGENRGFEYLYSYGAKSVTYKRVYHVKSRIYMVSVREEDGLTPEQAQEFFDSFKLIEPGGPEAMDALINDDAAFFPGAIVRFTAPIEGRALLEKLLSPGQRSDFPGSSGMLKGVQEASFQKKKYYRSFVLDESSMPYAGFIADERTLIFAPESMLRKMLAGPGQKGPLAERLGQLDRGADVSALFLPEPYLPLLDEEMKKVGNLVPPDLAKLSGQVRAVSASARIDGEPMLRLAVELKDDDSAKSLQKQAGGLLAMGKEFYQKSRQEIEGQLPPPLGKPALGVADQIVQGVKLEQEGKQAVLTIKKPEGLAELLAAAVPPIPPPGNGQITDLSLFSETCVETLRNVLSPIKGLSELNIDLKGRSATFKLKNRLATGRLLDAMKKAGFSGRNKIDEHLKVMRWQNAGVIGTGGKPLTETTIKQVHCCCQDCEKALTDLLKDYKVTFEGNGPVKTLKITGANLNLNAIYQGLQGAGFNITTGSDAGDED